MCAVVKMADATPAQSKTNVTSSVSGTEKNISTM